MLPASPPAFKIATINDASFSVSGPEGNNDLFSCNSIKLTLVQAQHAPYEIVSKLPLF